MNPKLIAEMMEDEGPLAAIYEVMDLIRNDLVDRGYRVTYRMGSDSYIIGGKNRRYHGTMKMVYYDSEPQIAVSVVAFDPYLQTFVQETFGIHDSYGMEKAIDGLDKYLMK